MQVTRKMIVVISIVMIVAVAVLAYLILQQGAEEWRVEIIVGDCRRTLSLPDLEKVSTDVELKNVGRLRCIPLVETVKACGVDLNATLIHRWVAVGADGYSRSVEEAYLYLSRAYLCLAGDVYPDWGPVRLVVEGLSNKYWVKQLIKVNVETGSWVLSLRVNGETKRVFSREELESLAVSVEGLGTAVPVTNLLHIVGISKQDVEVLEFVGTDGYRSVFHGGNVTRAYVLLIDPSDWSRNGPLRSAVLGAPRGTWVRHLVAVEVVAKG